MRRPSLQEQIASHLCALCFSIGFVPFAFSQSPDNPVTPEAATQPELTFHAPPKPLHPEAVTEDWSDFLGPTHNAISHETHLLKSFDEGRPNLVWEVAKGEGYAAPAVIGNRLILFHRVGNETRVECLQADTGKRYWKYGYPTSYRDRYGFGNGPRCQPISDGERVFVYGVEAKLTCLDLETGQLVWQRDLKAEFGHTLDFFGAGATPLLENGQIIVNVGAPGGPCVASFDAQTGALEWTAGDQWGPSYASPIPADTQAGRRVFVFAGGESRPATGGLLVIDPEDGRIDCRFPWRGVRYESVNASSPVIVDNHVYISECYGAGGALLNIESDGSCSLAWKNEILNTHFMTAIHKDGYLYGVDGHGPQNAPIVCIELATGKELWRHEPEWITPVESDGRTQEYNLAPALASFLLVDGRCLVLGQYGHLAWIDLNPNGYKELDRTHLFLARQTWALPTLSKGLLYIVQNDPGVDGTPTRLLCYDLRGS